MGLLLPDAGYGKGMDSGKVDSPSGGARPRRRRWITKQHGDEFGRGVTLREPRRRIAVVLKTFRECMRLKKAAHQESTHIFCIRGKRRLP
jgi:hypothetical protein